MYSNFPFKIKKNIVIIKEAPVVSVNIYRWFCFVFVYVISWLECLTSAAWKKNLNLSFVYVLRKKNIQNLTQPPLDVMFMQVIKKEILDKRNWT